MATPLAWSTRLKELPPATVLPIGVVAAAGGTDWTTATQTEAADATRSNFATPLM
jgi:hypothetical protein